MKRRSALLLTIILTAAVPRPALADARLCADLFLKKASVVEIISPSIDDRMKGREPSWDWALDAMIESQKRLEPADAKRVLTTLLGELFGETGEAIMRSRWSSFYRPKGSAQFLDAGYANSGKIMLHPVETRLHRKSATRRELIARENTQRKTSNDVYVLAKLMTEKETYQGESVSQPRIDSVNYDGSEARYNMSGPHLPMVAGKTRTPLKSFWDWVEQSPERILYAKLIMARWLDYSVTYAVGNKPMTIAQGLELFNPDPVRLTRGQRLRRWLTERKQPQQPSLTELAAAENKIEEIAKIVVKQADLTKALTIEPLKTVEPYTEISTKLRDEVAVLNTNEVLLFDNSPLMSASQFEADVHALVPRMLHAGVLTVTAIKAQSSSFGQLREKSLETAVRMESHQALIPGADWNPVRESKQLLDLRNEVNRAHADLEAVEQITAGVLENLLRFEEILRRDPHFATLISRDTVEATQRAFSAVRATNQELYREMIQDLSLAQNSLLQHASHH